MSKTFKVGEYVRYYPELAKDAYDELHFAKRNNLISGCILRLDHIDRGESHVLYYSSIRSNLNGLDKFFAESLEAIEDQEGAQLMYDLQNEQEL